MELVVVVEDSLGVLIFGSDAVVVGRGVVVVGLALVVVGLGVVVGTFR